MKLLYLLLLLPFSNAPISYRQLTWGDFKGKPTNDHLASSCTGIVIEKDTAYAIFEPDKSWTRTNDAATLSHEQLHFAITQMFASHISARKRVFSSNYVDYVLGQWEAMENLYDNATDHGRNLAKQKEWEEKIKL